MFTEGKQRLWWHAVVHRLFPSLPLAWNLLTVMYRWATGRACQDAAPKGTNSGSLALSSFTHTKGSQFPKCPKANTIIPWNSVTAGLLKGKICEGKVVSSRLWGEREPTVAPLYNEDLPCSSTRMPVFHQKRKHFLHLVSNQRLIVKVDIGIRTHESTLCKST